jgi:hypothetical protein
MFLPKAHAISIRVGSSPALAPDSLAPLEMSTGIALLALIAAIISIRVTRENWPVLSRRWPDKPSDHDQMICEHFPRKQAGATTDRWCRRQSRPPAPHILGSDNIPTLLHQRLVGSHDRTAQLLAAPGRERCL